jgi:hypothetical protein
MHYLLTVYLESLKVFAQVEVTPDSTTVKVSDGNNTVTMPVERQDLKRLENLFYKALQAHDDVNDGDV